ncbi:MAG: energy-coupling factor transporter transmembrane protein EcfT [Saccharofermentans sp.]|jgi:energy-coupling factor transport system permease protein|nr:energy-coupling factor transporter transmembrane protein EcfT [Saccharofermentans sp.]
MDLTFYGEDVKGLIRVDPRTKVLIFLTSSLVCVSSYSDLGIALYSVLLCILFALCGKPLTALKAAIALGVVLFIRTVMSSSQGAPEVVVMVITLVTTSFMFAFPTLMSIYLIVKTTRISHFLSAFQAMHIPVKAVVPVAVFFRFLPTVTDEWNGIRKAMAFRGISLSPVQIIAHPWRTIEFVLIPMLFSTMSVMEELAAATMARGMDIEVKRSSYEEVKLHMTDYLLIVLFIALFILSAVIAQKLKEGTV